MSSSPFGFDATLDLSGAKHRRIVLAVLAEQQQSFTLDDLAKAIVKHNHHTPLKEASGETITQIKTELYHCHIPKLEDTGVVEYDADRHVVEPTAAFERLEPHLSAILDADPELSPSLTL